MLNIEIRNFCKEFNGKTASIIRLKIKTSYCCWALIPFWSLKPEDLGQSCLNITFKKFQKESQ